MLAAAGTALAAAATVPTLAQAEDRAVDTPADPNQARTSTAPASSRPPGEPFGYCLNLSTIRGQNLSLAEEVETAAKAGYAAVEPWLPKMDEYVKGGGSLKDLGKRIKDLGLTVESAIGFAEWIVDDDARRAKGLENMRRDMDALVQLGGKRIAAPPIGAHDQDAPALDLLKAAERYHAVCELGANIGVVPQVEVWGFSKHLHRLGQAAAVAIDSGHPRACILADIYHLYKGGAGGPEGLRLLNGGAMHVLHVNDYPDVPRPQITDAHRVYPGDGVAPVAQILRTLRDTGFRGFLSLELFNEDYYKQDALTVARTGLEKTRAAVRKALG